MTREEHLLTIVAEECNEVAQRATKALRFSLEEIEPGQEFSNRERLFQEKLKELKKRDPFVYKNF